MKENEIGVETNSRRNFTKFALATLLATPIAGSMLSCRSDTNRNDTNRNDTGQERYPTLQNAEGFTDRPTPQTFEHIPPMTVADGSLMVDCHELFVPPDGQASGGKYLYQRPAFESISKVTIMVTNEADFGTPYWCLYGPPVVTPRDVRIKIWLQEKEVSGDGYAPLLDMGALGTLPPQVVIWDAGSDLLKMECDKQLARTGTKHPKRPHRYTHDAYTRHLRIGAIEVTSSNWNPARWITRDYDRYRIQIFGKHIPHLKVAPRSLAMR